MNYSSTINLIKCTLFNQKADNIQESELSKIFETLKSQAVAALPYYLIRDYKIDEWNRFCAASLANWIKVMHGQEELLKLLEANNIPCVIIKGARLYVFRLLNVHYRDSFFIEKLVPFILNLQMGHIIRNPLAGFRIFLF